MLPHKVRSPGLRQGCDSYRKEGGMVHLRAGAAVRRRQVGQRVTCRGNSARRDPPRRCATATWVISPRALILGQLFRFHHPLIVRTGRNWPLKTYKQSLVYVRATPASAGWPPRRLIEVHVCERQLPCSTCATQPAVHNCWQSIDIDSISVHNPGVGGVLQTGPKAGAPRGLMLGVNRA